MNIQKLLSIFAVLLFICSILLVKFQIGSFSFFHIWIVFILLLLVFVPNKSTNQRFFQLDPISLSIIFFLIIAVVSYVINVSNADLVSKTYSSNSLESPSFLYSKIAFNGIFFIVSALVAYQLGKTISTSKKTFLKIYNIVIGLCLLNAFVNVIAWLITTGGVIGRYNFEPPITFSPGVSIQYSSIGFLLGLAALTAVKVSHKRKVLVLGLAILLLSILIILTRQSQVSFLVMCIWYYFKTHKISLKAIFITIPVLFSALLIVLFILYSQGMFDSYGIIESEDSVDVAVRLLMLSSSYDIFLAHPFFGVGYGMFVGHNTVPIIITGVPMYLASPHNGIASILCELGIFGIVALIIMIFIVIKNMKISLHKAQDPIIFKYCCAIYIIQVIFILSVVISNSNLFGPPAELPYLYISFISWFMIGSVIGVSKTNL